MDWSEYIMVQTSIIPEESVIAYNLKEKLHNWYIFERVNKDMY